MPTPGAGLSASFGIATETTPGTPVAVTRFVEFESETLAPKKGISQGKGLRGGAYVPRAARRVLTAREAAGNVTFAATTNGLGLFLTHMLGSFNPTINNLGGGLYQQIHNAGGVISGHSFTTQIVRPDTSGVLTQEAYTYPGCKITDWKISGQAKETLKVELTIDALDEATPTNAFAGTTLSASTTAAATSFTSVATIPAGSWVTVDTGSNAETVQTGTPTGAGPFTIPVTSPGGLKVAHVSGVYVGSATGVNYGAAAALQTATYNATTTEFGYDEGTLILGGTTSSVSGVWTNTGGVSAGVVKTFTISGKNAVDTGRFGLGSKVRAEQLDNGWREYTFEAEVDFGSRALYDQYIADQQADLQLKFTNPLTGAILEVTAPAMFLEDGSTPNVSGPGILSCKLKGTLLDDGVNGHLQIIYTSTDSAV